MIHPLNFWKRNNLFRNDALIYTVPEVSSLGFDGVTQRPSRLRGAGCKRLLISGLMILLWGGTGQVTGGALASLYCAAYWIGCHPNTPTIFFPPMEPVLRSVTVVGLTSG